MRLVLARPQLVMLADKDVNRCLANSSLRLFVCVCVSGKQLDLELEIKNPNKHPVCNGRCNYCVRFLGVFWRETHTTLVERRVKARGVLMFYTICSVDEFWCFPHVDFRHVD